MDFPDWTYRLTYRLGFRAARLVWRVMRPRHSGALVMLWHRDMVLLVRSSYGEGWMAPGGGIEGNETPVEAAVREAREELGLALRPEDLRLALVTEHLWNHRHDKVHVFEADLDEPQAIRLDNRELVEARFVTLAEALRFPIAPHLQDYFRLKAGTGPV